VTHHGDEHVDKNDDDGDVVQRKQEHSDSFHNRRRVISTWKSVCVLVVLVLARFFTIYLPSTSFFSRLSEVIVLARFFTIYLPSTSFFSRLSEVLVLARFFTIYLPSTPFFSRLSEVLVLARFFTIYLRSTPFFSRLSEVLVLARFFAIYLPSTPFFSRLSEVLVLARVLNLDAVDAHESKHRPEQTEERSRQPEDAHTTHHAYKLRRSEFTRKLIKLAYHQKKAQTHWQDIDG